MHTIGGGTSFTFRDAKFIEAPARAAARGQSAFEAGQIAFGARGLLMSKAPTQQTANSATHLRGIASPSSTRLSKTKKAGENVTTNTMTSPSGRQDRIEI